jgi:hypothetical protein
MNREKNHSDFLIVDGDENEFRKNFENEMSIFLPVILVLIQGGYNELENILNGIHRQMSILIIAVNYHMMMLLLYLFFNFYRILEDALVC